jgi:hypothetical protein
MTTQTTAVRRQTQGLRGALALTAATAALVGGVVLWQVRQGGDASTTPITSSATATSEVSAGLAAASDVPAARTIDQVGQIFVVSPDQEDAIRGAMAELDNQRQALGLPPIAAKVIAVAPGQEGQDLLLALVNDGNLTAPGHPGFVVTDLRAR